MEEQQDKAVAVMQGRRVRRLSLGDRVLHVLDPVVGAWATGGEEEEEDEREAGGRRRQERERGPGAALAAALSTAAFNPIAPPPSPVVHLSYAPSTSRRM